MKRGRIVQVILEHIREMIIIWFIIIPLLVGYSVQSQGIYLPGLNVSVADCYFSLLKPADSVFVFIMVFILLTQMILFKSMYSDNILVRYKKRSHIWWEALCRIGIVSLVESLTMTIYVYCFGMMFKGILINWTSEKSYYVSIFKSTSSITMIEVVGIYFLGMFLACFLTGAIYLVISYITKYHVISWAMFMALCVYEDYKWSTKGIYYTKLTLMMKDTSTIPMMVGITLGIIVLVSIIGIAILRRRDFFSDY